MNPIGVQKCQHLPERLLRGVVRIDIMTRVRRQESLRAGLAGGREVCCEGRGSLVGRVRAIAAAVEVVVLAIDNVDGTTVLGCRRVGGGKGECFTERVCLFICR